MADALTLFNMAMLHNPWYGRMYLNGAMDAAMGVNILPFDEVDYDPSSSCTTGAAAGVTIPTNGMYWVTISVGWDIGSAVWYYQAIIEQNANIVRVAGVGQTTDGVTTYPVTQTSGMIKCTAGDLIQGFTGSSFDGGAVLFPGYAYTFIEWMWMRPV